MTGRGGRRAEAVDCLSVRRSWVRRHGLQEGEPVDLDRLRAEVLGDVAQG